jgi:hypothetical protein
MGYRADLYLATLPVSATAASVHATTVQKPAGEIPGRWADRNYLEPEVHLPVFDRNGRQHSMTLTLDAQAERSIGQATEDTPEGDHADVTLWSDALPRWARYDVHDDYALPSFSLPTLTNAISQLKTMAKTPERVPRHRRRNASFFPERDGDRAAVQIAARYSTDHWLFGTLQRRRFASNRIMVGMFQSRGPRDQNSVIAWPGDPRRADIVFDLLDLHAALTLATTVIDEADVVYKSQIVDGSWI